MAEANFPVFNGEGSDFEHFTLHLAAYCNQYVMEVAKPIMEKSRELFEDKAIVYLVDKWFEADKAYDHKRQSYLVQWAQYDPEDEHGIEPYDGYKWEKRERDAYKVALDAIIIGW